MISDNGSGITVSERTKVTLGMVLTVLALGSVALSGWITVTTQARASLSREEAYERFVCKSDYAVDRGDLDKRLERMEAKLDRLMERR